MTPGPDKILTDFVEGRLSPEAFEQILYSNTDLESVLKDAPRLSPNHYFKSDVYTFLIGLDYRDAGDVLDAFGAVGDFLMGKQIAFEPTSSYDDLHSVILSAQPDWLLVDTAYVSKMLLPQAGTRTGQELKEWLRQQFLERFKYVDRTPRWLQTPSWPFGKSGPLVFLGQLSVTDYFHDEAAAYVFYDPETGQCETILQVC
jgi:hypothetical protein